MEIFLLVYLCVNIAFRARARGLKPLPWVLRTVLAAFAGMLIAWFVVFYNWMKTYGSTPKDVERIQEMVKSGELMPNEWNLLFIYVLAIGGYLLVRYRLDKHPKITNDGQGGSPPQ